MSKDHPRPVSVVRPLVRTHRFWRTLEWCAVGLAAVLVGLGLALTWALRTGRAADLVEERVVQLLEEACGIDTRFESLRVSPLAASLEIVGLELRTSGGDQELLSVKDAYLRLRRWPLLRGRIHIARLVLSDPRASVRVGGGQWLDRPACLGPRREGAAPPQVAIDEASVSRGGVSIRIDEGTALTLGGLSLGAWAGRSGGTELNFELQSGELVREGRRFELGGVRALGRVEGSLLSPRFVRLEQLQGRLGSLRVDAGAKVDLLGPVYDGEVRLSAALKPLGAFDPAWPELGGELEMQVRVRGVGADVSASGRTVIEGGRIGKRTLGRRLEVAFEVDRSGVSLSEVQARLGAGGVRASGRIEFDEHLSFRAQATTERLSFARFMEALGETGVWVDFEASGPTEVRGRLRPLRIGGPFDFEVAGVDVWTGSWQAPEIRSDPDAKVLDTVPVRVKGGWTFIERAIEFHAVQLSTAHIRGRVEGRVRYRKPGSVHLDIDFERFDFADLGPVGGLAMDGVGQVTGRLHGKFSDLSASGAVDLEGVALADVPLGNATAEVRWDGGKRLSVRGVEGVLGHTRWYGDVGVRFGNPTPVSARGEITRGRLGDLLLPLGLDPEAVGPLEGSVGGRFSFTGPVRRWSGPLTLQVSDARASGQRLGDVELKGRLDSGRLRVRALTASFEGARLTAEGWFSPQERTFEARARSAGLRLGQVDAIAARLPELDGDVSVRLDLRGELTRPTGTVRVGWASLRAGDTKMGSGRSTLTLSGRQAKLESRFPGVAAELNGEVRLVSGSPYTLRLRLQRSSLPTALARLAGVEADGVLTAQADLNGQLTRPMRSSGTIRLGQFRGRVQDTNFEVQTPLKLSLNQGVLRLDALRLTGTELRLSGSGRVGPGVLDLSVEGRLDLRILDSWVASIERSGGRFDFRGRLRRGPAGLDLVGAGHIEDGSLEWRGVPNRLSGVRGDLTFSQSSLLVDELAGRWAGGQVGMRGSMSLEGLRPTGVGFEVKVQGARPRLPLAWMDLTGRLDGAIDVGGTGRKLVARGQLGVRGGRAQPRTDIADIVGARRIAAAYDPSAERIEVDIGLRLEERFRVKNDDMDINLGGELRLTGTNERLGILGSLVLEQGGRVSFVGREYTTEGGLIEFRDRLRVDPRYDLSVSTSACDARVRLNLVGNLDEVRTAYTSNPEMDRQDIVSCLIRGIRRRDLDQDLASFAGSALLKLSGVDRQVKRVLPIDQLDVTTEFSSRARAYEPRLLVAKDLSLLDRPVRLEYSSSLFRNDDLRAALRVRLTPRLSLQLGWTSSEDVPTGDWGLDLSRRWEW